MVRAFWLVICDLWQFICDSFGLVWPHPQRLLNAKPSHGSLEKSGSVPLLPVSTTEAQPTLLTLANDYQHTEPGSLYFVTLKDGAPLQRFSTYQFDDVLMIVPYGQSVVLKQFVGRYAEVLVAGVVGFIEKDFLTTDGRQVHPTLMNSYVYDAFNEETQKLRCVIKDDFGGGKLSLHLQSTEYITYRLLKDQLSITWPKVRPRLAGDWHTILRGVRGLHSSVTPSVDTVMEWVDEEGEGKLAYVENILSDSMLRISAVGIMVLGEYTESLVPESVWREWRPVFINVR